MTIHLPEDLERSIRAEVLSGHFASEDDLVAAAVRDYLGRQQEQAHQDTAAASATDVRPVTPSGRRPLWERAAELRKSIPEEEWAKLPAPC